jgi:hypothetical protein
MNFWYKTLLFLIFCLFEFGFSCNKKYRNKESVEAAMRYYDHLILKTDADSIALLYMSNGELGNIAAGRDSIRNFLNRFGNFKVIYQTRKYETVKPPSIFQSSPKLAVSVATSMVNAISEAPGLVNRPKNTRMPPGSSWLPIGMRI